MPIVAVWNTFISSIQDAMQIEGMPEEVVFDHLHATAFQHSPLGRTILGPSENIQSLTRDDLAKYISTHYTAPRMASHSHSYSALEILTETAGCMIAEE